MKNKINFAIRVDSSAQIGSGHLMRCLTLANHLSDKVNILFICRDLENNLSSLVKKNGFDLILLSREDENHNLTGYEKWLTVKQDFDAEQTKTVIENYEINCVIIDHYAIDEPWENIIRSCTKKIMVIDDLANRKHNCDILLDQNYYKNFANRYEGLVPENCQLFLGPQYVLLREEFYKEKGKMRIRDGSIKNILVFFGEIDHTNETIKALQAIKELNRTNITVKAVVGSGNKHKEMIKEFCQQNEHMHYLCQVTNMAQLINEADLAIGAGGTTTWERCFLGLPAIVIAIAENQIKISEDCAELGIIKHIGEAESIDSTKLSYFIMQMIQNKKYAKNMAQKAYKLVVGSGVNKVVSEVLT